MKLGLIGDVHERWGEPDVRHLDAARYAAVLVTGDLPGRMHRRTLQIARGIAALQTPVIAIPGNHDGTRPLQVAAETVGRLTDLSWHVREQRQRVAELEAAYHPHVLGGYSLHTVSDGSEAVDVLVARPHAMDGRRLTFRAQLQHRYGVASLEDSAARLKALIDAARNPIVVLCHNGPHGLGMHGPWGLPRMRRDNGDRDLQEAIAHGRGKVIAVCGGHAHHGRGRSWRIEDRGVLYVNAAQVPRVFERDGRTWRHHVCLAVSGGRISAEQVLVQSA